MITQAIYLLYGGTSVDGRGPATFIGATCNPEEVEAHFKTLDSPYSVGYIDKIKGDKIERVYSI